MILQTLSIVIIISLIKFNQFISKIIAFVGPLIFDVYLIHENHYIRNFIFKISKIKKICIKIDLLTTKITHYFI